MKIYVGNIGPKISRQTVENLVKKYAPIKSIEVIPLNKEKPNESRGFVYINAEITVKELAKMKSDLGGTKLGHPYKHLRIEIAKPLKKKCILVPKKSFSNIIISKRVDKPISNNENLNINLWKRVHGNLCRTMKMRFPNKTISVIDPLVYRTNHIYFYHKERKESEQKNKPSTIEQNDENEINFIEDSSDSQLDWLFNKN